MRQQRVGQHCGGVVARSNTTHRPPLLAPAPRRREPQPMWTRWKGGCEPGDVVGEERDRRRKKEPRPPVIGREPQPPARGSEPLLSTRESRPSASKSTCRHRLLRRPRTHPQEEGASVGSHQIREHCWRESKGGRRRQMPDKGGTARRGSARGQARG